MAIRLAYRTIVADPPWPVTGHTWSLGVRSDPERTNKGRPQGRYPVMPLPEIMALRPLVAESAHLYLWVVSNHVDWGYAVAREWGFQPVILWTWCKPGLGVGRFRCNTEHITVARRGSRHDASFGKTADRHLAVTQGTWFGWPRGRHSEKPGAFFDLVEALSPLPRLEMFARTRRLGWDAWGNEVDSDVEIGVAS